MVLFVILVFIDMEIDVMTDLQRDFIIQAIEGGCTPIDLKKMLQCICNYAVYSIDFHRAFTPEAESLARWNLQTAREDFYPIAKRYGVEMYDISSLAEE